MLIVLGCYWLSLWVVVIPIMMLDSKFTGGIIYIGTLGALLMHVITAIPISIVAFGAGILCVYSIEGISQKKWLLIRSLHERAANMDKTPAMQCITLLAFIGYINLMSLVFFFKVWNPLFQLSHAIWAVQLYSMNYSRGCKAHLTRSIQPFTTRRLIFFVESFK